MSQLNELRDRPAGSPILGLARPTVPRQQPLPPHSRLVELAIANRPELARAKLIVASQSIQVELENRNDRPDLTVGLNYSVVDRRRDPAGRADPPTDNGEDMASIYVAIPLPLRKQHRRASQIASQDQLRSFEERQLELVSRFESEVGDLATRLPLLGKHHRLLSGLLETQTRMALEAAQTAYSVGDLSANDLLEVELQRFEVATSTARTAADYSIAAAQLERALAVPLARVHATRVPTDPEPPIEPNPNTEPQGHVHD